MPPDVPPECGEILVVEPLEAEFSGESTRVVVEKWALMEAWIEDDGMSCGSEVFLSYRVK